VAGSRSDVCVCVNTLNRDNVRDYSADAVGEVYMYVTESDCGRKGRVR
jgi:hypothetical protein